MKKILFVASVLLLLGAGCAAEELITYRNEAFGFEMRHPASWYAYGEKSESSNPDALSWRFFVPDYDPGKSMEQQEVFSVQIYNKNAESTFDAPKRFIVRTRTDEKWEDVTINGQPGVRILNTGTGEVTDYVFEHRGVLFDLNASRPDLFDKIMPTVTFF